MFFSISFSQVFFSSMLKVLVIISIEIYNGTAQNIDLTNYAFPNATNGADIDGTYDYWNVFQKEHLYRRVTFMLYVTEVQMILFKLSVIKIIPI